MLSNFRIGKRNKVAVRGNRDSRNHYLYQVWFTVCVVTSFLCGSIANAAQVVLTDIKIQPRGEDTHVVFDLGIPLNYVKHFPTNAGEILQIQMLLEEESGREIHKEVRQGAELTPPPGMEPLLVYVTYEEGVPGGPYLTLRFARPVSFEVEAGESLTTLSVLIRDDQQKKAKPKAAPVIAEKPEDTSKPTPTAPLVPPVPPSKRGVPEISMKALEEQVFKQAQKTEKQLEEKSQDDKPAKDAQPAAAAAVPSAKPSVPEKPASEVDELMAKARQALTFGDNDGAIQLLRRVIAMPESEHTQDARELVGLALERSNQLPRAKFEYKKYLKIYKEGDGPTRVRQRLQALQSIDTEQRKKLRKTVRRDKDVFTTFGRWSQAFTARFQQREAENDDDDVQSEDLVLTRRFDSYMSLRSRMRTADRNIQTVFTGNHVLDLMESDETEYQINSFYLDYDAFAHGYYTIMGRQRVRNSGVFGRFDGAIAGYDFLPFMRAHVYIGKPVELNDDRNIDKDFWGVKVDIGKRNDPINMNLYSVRQTADGIADRQAFGAGVRYSDREMTLFGLMDYDYLFQEINLLNFRWGWKYLENSKLNISYNSRQLLFVSSALNNQPLNTSLGQVVDLLTEEGARELAKDRTSLSETLTIGNSYQFDRDNQLNVDLTIFKSSGTVTRTDLTYPNDPIPGETITCETVDSNINIPECVMVNVTGAPATGNQYTLSAQWISGNLFAQRDLYVFGTRLSSFDSYDDVTLFVNARMPDISNWKPRPRLTVSYRTFNEESNTEGSRTSIAPSVQIDYAWKREWIFDAELGFEIVEYTDPDFDDEVRENIRIGYTYTF